MAERADSGAAQREGAKQCRLAEALRTNLKRRKTQARERQDIAHDGATRPGVPLAGAEPESSAS